MKFNTDVQFAIMVEEIKTLKKKDHKSKSKASSSNKYLVVRMKDQRGIV